MKVSKSRPADTYRAARRNRARYLHKHRMFMSQPTRDERGRAIPARPIRRLTWGEAWAYAKHEVFGNMSKK
jgi:hypothetical protein